MWGSADSAPKNAVASWDVIGLAVDAISVKDGQFLDRTIAEWSAPAVFVAGSAAYLLLVLVMKRVMDKRAAPMSLAGAMKVYNAVQVLINLNLLLRFCYTAKMDLLGPHYIFFINNPFTAQMKLNVFVHYVTKYDTHRSTSHPPVPAVAISAPV